MLVYAFVFGIQELYPVALTFIITCEDLHCNVNVNICNFAIFGPIFMKFLENIILNLLKQNFKTLASL